jgi:hypothetical protein
MASTGTGAFNARVYAASSPGAAFTVVTAAMFNSMNSPLGVAASSLTGLCLYDNVSGKPVFFGLNPSGLQTFLDVLQYSSFTSETTVVLVQFAQIGPLIWLKIVDDGTTTRTYSYSVDGVFWVTFYSEARTTFITSPPKVGYCFDIYRSSVAAVGASFISWTLTSP